jgi:hypothetical protein
MACANIDGTGKNDTSLKKDSITDSISLREGKHDITAIVKIVVPVGNEALNKGVCDFIMNAIRYNDSTKITVIAPDVKSLAQSMLDSISSMLKGATFYEGEESSGPPLWHNVEASILDETAKTITIGIMQDIYLGGPHGSALVEGATFNKADGKRLDASIFAQDKLTDIKKEVTEGLKEFFGPLGNEEDSPLKDENGKDKIVELPEKGIYINKDSVVFIYQQYEIAPYAYGIPSTALSLKDMKKKGLLEPEFAKNVE